MFKAIRKKLFPKLDEGFSGSGRFYVAEPSAMNYPWRFGYYTDNGQMPVPIVEGVWSKEVSDLFRSRFKNASLTDDTTEEL